MLRIRFSSLLSNEQICEFDEHAASVLLLLLLLLRDFLNKYTNPPTALQNQS